MLEKLRLRLANPDAILPLAILGLLVGLLAGAIIIAFRLLIQYLQSFYLPPGPEDYTSVDVLFRLLLPTLGGLLIGLIFHFTPPADRYIGVVHVIERLTYFHGYLPLRNAVLQFFGAALSIASGHSVGREGPSVHLGAASGSLAGKWLHLPNNSIRTLVACGVAAAIGASFNTPLAGVIFAMEVVMMEYTIGSFTPVILASFSATMLSREIYGTAPAFIVPALEMGSVHELPVLFATAIAVGLLAASFTALLHYFSKLMTDTPVWFRMALGGLITGLCAVSIPQIMGVSYGVVNDTLLGQVPLWLMLSILVLKLLATAAGLGMGLPGGLIGPSMVLGAMVGGSVGLTVSTLFPGEMSSHGFYAMLGMGAMMGATLQAPLAALMALLELTANPNILLPAMLTVIVSGLISKELVGGKSIYLILLEARGLTFRHNPLAQSLHHIGVASVMNRNFAASERFSTREALQRLMKQSPQWVVIKEDNKPQALLPGADLALYLKEESGDKEKQEEEKEQIDLMEIPAARQKLTPVPRHVTLWEALDMLDKAKSNASYITREDSSGVGIYGILTRKDIEATYRYSD